MANRDKREALRGAEEETLDVIAQVLTSDQWAELLKAPLERAAADGNRGLAQKLVSAGAKIGDALHEAARSGHGDMVSDLLDNGASVVAKDSSRGMTPLHVAAYQGGTEMVQLLLLKGADIDTLDNNKCTPLSLAAYFDHVAAAQALLAAGADVNLRCGRQKESVAHLAAKRGHVEVLRAAIESGADVDAVDGRKCTPLHAAAIYSKVEAIIVVLLEAGAYVEVRNDDGCTPLYYAARMANFEAGLALLKHGADVNTQGRDQNTPLLWAAVNAGCQGAAEMVDSLLRSGADETILNNDGQAPADLVGINAYEEAQLAVGRVRELLANAPADRIWRRRGYLVLCRAHPDRVQQVHESSSARAGLTRTTCSGAKLARIEACGSAGTAESSTLGGRTGGDWAGLVARVLGLQEEGIFRTIVGYL